MTSEMPPRRSSAIPPRTSADAAIPIRSAVAPVTRRDPTDSGRIESAVSTRYQWPSSIVAATAPSSAAPERLDARASPGSSGAVRGGSRAPRRPIPAMPAASARRRPPRRGTAKARTTAPASRTAQKGASGRLRPARSPSAIAAAAPRATRRRYPSGTRWTPWMIPAARRLPAARRAVRTATVAPITIARSGNEVAGSRPCRPGVPSRVG